MNDLHNIIQCKIGFIIKEEVCDDTRDYLLNFRYLEYHSYHTGLLVQMNVRRKISINNYLILLKKVEEYDLEK